MIEWTEVCNRAVAVITAVFMGLIGCAVVAVTVVHAPVPALALALGGVAIVMLLARPPIAVAVLVASFYFEGYLSKGVGELTVSKGIGLLAFGAWLVGWLLGRRPIYWDSALMLLAIFLALMIPSVAGAQNASVAVVEASRYVNFAVLFFLVIQVSRADPRSTHLLVNVAVTAATGSATIGLFNFLSGRTNRANGPVMDPNDFGFLLASTLPLAIHVAMTATGMWRRRAAAVAVAILSVTLLATLSRTSIVGLVGAGLWLIAARRVRLRWLVAALGAILVLGLGANFAFHGRVQTALTQKNHVASSNVSSRLTFYRVAIEEFRTSPLFGVGPANFQVRYPEFDATFDPQQGSYTTHNAYLNVLADLGLPSCIVFVSFLALGWRRASRKPTGDGRSLQTSIAAGYLVALIGSMFLTEQFYAPLWLLSALASTISAIPDDVPSDIDIASVPGSMSRGASMTA